MFERIKVPFIFVPHGEEPDPAALARFSDPIRVPARFVPRDAGVGRLQPQPISQGAAIQDAAGNGEAGKALNEAVLGSGEPGAGEPSWLPSAYDPAQADPIGDYLRVEGFLARAGFPNAVERKEGGRPENESIVLAQAATPGGAQEARPGDRLAATGVPAGHVAADPRRWIGGPSVGTGECVPLVQQATGAPSSRLWRPGPVVQGNTAIQPGTAIATFDSNGRYTGHAAIYLGQNEHGLRVVDQWNNRDREDHIISQKSPGKRTLYFNDPRHARVNRGESYRVVE